MKHKILKRGLIFTMLLALIFSSTIFAFADETSTWKVIQKAENPTYDLPFAGSSVIDGKFYTFGQHIFEFNPESGAITLKNQQQFTDWDVAATYNGKAFVFGMCKDVYEYDPSTNTLSAKAPLLQEGTGFQTEVVGDKIYVLGGSPFGAGDWNAVQEYDISQNKWTKKASMGIGRAAFQTQVINNKVYAIGGEITSSKCTNTVEEYDPSTNIWTPKASMTTPRGHFCSQVIDNKIYVMGGRASGDLGSITNTVEVYDPTTDKWSTIKPMKDARDDFNSVVLNNKIYAIGGRPVGQINQYLSSVEEYDPKNDIWKQTASLNSGRWEFAVCALNNTIYAMGGYCSQKVVNVEAYTPDLSPAQTSLNLQATSGDSTVSLSWNKIDGATSYNVKCSTTKGGPYTNVATGVTDTKYTDSTVSNGTTYYYVVSAVTSSGEGSNSNEVAATPQKTASSGNAILDIKMDDGSTKEYRLTSGELIDFLTWYESRSRGEAKAFYTFHVKGDVSPFSSIDNYIPFDKILSYDVKFYS